MDLDESLELDYLIEKISDDTIEITDGPTLDPSSIDYINKKIGIFNPPETGTYTLSINGQEVEVEVINIPDSALTEDLVAWYRFEDGDARDYASSNIYANDPWGDPTAYDGTVNNVTFQPTGGITDFTGTNSGAFDFTGNNTSEINLPNSAAQTDNSTKCTHRHKRTQMSLLANIPTVKKHLS